MRCHTARGAGEKERGQRGGAAGVRPSARRSPLRPDLPAPEPILMRPLCWMKMVSLVRFPWMMGGLQACRKLPAGERRAESGSGARGGGRAGQGRGAGGPASPERRQDLRAPALPGLAAGGRIRGSDGRGEAAGPAGPPPRPLPRLNPVPAPEAAPLPARVRTPPLPAAAPARSPLPIPARSWPYGSSWSF